MLNRNFIVLRAFAVAAALFVSNLHAIAEVSDLTREVNIVRKALDKAAADAATGQIRPLQMSLKSAQDSWAHFYVGYRAWGSGADPSWVSDIDAIQAEFINATNAVSPGNNAPLAAASLARIEEKLTGLLDRNDVPNVEKAVSELNASLTEVETSMKALEGKAIGPDSLAALSQQWTQISQSWTSFNKVLIEANPLNLSDSELAALKQRADRQSVLFNAVGDALGNANLRAGLTSLGSAVEGLRALTSQWSAQADPKEAAAKSQPLDSSRRRGLNLR